MDGLWKDDFGNLYRLTEVGPEPSKMGLDGYATFTAYKGRPVKIGHIENVDGSPVERIPGNAARFIYSVMPSGMRFLMYIRDGEILPDGTAKVILVDEPASTKAKRVFNVPIQDMCITYHRGTNG